MNRKSLVIGINKYDHFSELDNAANDAEDMHVFLKGCGFESTLLINSNQKELIAAIQAFKNTISDNTVSLIFFSGHGLQDDKHNFMVATDSQVKSLEDIKYQCVHVDDLLVEYTKSNLHFIILDACRNNPFYKGHKGMSVGLLYLLRPSFLQSEFLSPVLCVREQ
jgi:uncharacterized caspase-like protein